MTKNANTVKTPITSKFYFNPQTEEEKEYLEKLQELVNAKRRSDWGLVSEMVNIPVKSVEKAFYRVYSKHHSVVVQKLSEVIKNRKQLLNPEL